MVTILPGAAVISGVSEIADMICISSQGVCGEDEVRLTPFEKRQIVGWEGR